MVVGWFGERAVGERSEVAGASAAAGGPELVERPRRRAFSAEYRLRVLRGAGACTEPGGVGALLRREGLCSGYLSKWRRLRGAGVLEALGRSRGRRPVDRRELELAELQRRLERSEAELVKARKVIEVQGNLFALLGQLLATEGATKLASAG